MKKINAVLLLVGLLVSESGFTMEVGKDVIHLMGGATCGSWIASRAQNDVSMLSKISWLVGYMSGIASGTNKDILNNIDGESITLWMDNYCKANPLENTTLGGNILAIELMKRKGI